MKNHRIFFWAITSALGGFLFGFDTAVISGGEQNIQLMWQLSDIMTGQMVAMALYGTIIGAIFGGVPAQKFGRKLSLIGIAALFLVSAAGSALAPEIYSLMFFRFIGGLSIGASSVVAPMYISEIAPAEQRGKLTAMFQFNIVLGILIAYFSNYLIGSGDVESWRWMLGVEVIPATLFLVMVFTLPESPRWLIVAKNRVEEARKTLAIINPDTVEESVRSIRESDTHPGRAAKISEFFTKRYSFPIILAFLFAFFNQVSGINAIIYFAPRIFDLTGMGADAALLSSVGVGVVNLVFTMLGLLLIDRFGRRFLMYIGSFGYIISLSAISWAFFTETFTGLLVPSLIFLFIASHAIGQGAVIWVFISEIFPNAVRSFGNSLGSSTHWVFAALIAGNFVYIESLFGGGPIFAFFAFMMFLQLLFVWKVMPETKNVSLEEMEEKLGIRNG
ncbi:sugar porter family MFS transporter [Rhodohalobacter mucosus]|uniref:MFS transporter n=1 Tax=Rhodohalobacter mucosus TaxID=2079485 RepID=A0A316TXT6_9BACT|nr:sugar porter family MFS transporter [Rhodohalobacter mucosus]PWN07494.1 MFS transporter [Rhodohalobacter mucosus]